MSAFGVVCRKKGERSARTRLDELCLADPLLDLGGVRADVPEEAAVQPVVDLVVGIWILLAESVQLTIGRKGNDRGRCRTREEGRGWVEETG